jgi:cobalt/nickel transport system permease protein
MSLLPEPGPAGAIAGLDPRSRVLAALGFALVTTTLDQPPALLAALALALALALAARLPAAATLRRLAALDGFMVLTLAMLPFTVPGAPWLTLAGLPASFEGTARALTILVRANAAVLALLALVGTLEPVTLGRALARLGLPDRLVWLYLFTIRYLDVLHREYLRLATAMRARGFRPGTDRHTWRSLGLLFGMLLVRSLERSERIIAAMRCRGFDGRLRPLAEETAFGPPDRLFALASGGGLGLLAVAGTGVL